MKILGPLLALLFLACGSAPLPDYNCKSIQKGKCMSFCRNLDSEMMECRAHFSTQCLCENAASTFVN